MPRSYWIRCSRRTDASGASGLVRQELEADAGGGVGGQQADAHALTDREATAVGGTLADKIGRAHV